MIALEDGHRLTYIPPLLPLFFCTRPAASAIKVDPTCKCISREPRYAVNFQTFSGEMPENNGFPLDGGDKRLDHCWFNRSSIEPKYLGAIKMIAPAENTMETHNSPVTIQLRFVSGATKKIDHEVLK